MRTPVTLTAEAALLLALVRADPYDATLQGAACDALQESGINARTAKVRVNKVARDERCARVRARFTADTAEGRRLQQGVRKWFAKRYPTGPRFLPLVLKPGPGSPKETGTRAHYETPSGSRVYHPNSYARAGGRIRYVNSTRRLEVGADWVLTHVVKTAHLPPVTTPVPDPENKVT